MEAVLACPALLRRDDETPGVDAGRISPAPACLKTLPALFGLDGSIAQAP